MSDNLSYKNEVKRLIAIAYSRCVSDISKYATQIKIVVEDIVDENINLIILKQALKIHSRKSQYPPNIANILEIIKENDTEKLEFRDRFLKETSDYFGVIKDDEIRAIANKIGKSKIRNNPSETTINEAYQIYKKIKNGQLLLENNRLIES